MSPASPPPLSQACPVAGEELREEDGLPPFLARPDWREAFPWLLHGVTIRRPPRLAAPGSGEGDGDRRSAPGGEEDFDLRLRGGAPGGRVLARWDCLLGLPGVSTVVHARQVHGAAIRVHGALAPGLLLAPPCDGHATREPELLLTVSLADCVPIFLVEPAQRVVALLHAGWRGTAAGILEEGIGVLCDHFDADPARVHVHLGPAIGGASYEVGPEVHEALGRPVPSRPECLDLRQVLAERAVGAGVPRDSVGVSARDTFTDPFLFSHRGGDEGRHVAFVGVRRRPGGRR